MYDVCHVMAGLDPVIHEPMAGVDGQVQPGHDDKWEANGSRWIWRS